MLSDLKVDKFSSSQEGKKVVYAKAQGIAVRLSGKMAAWAVVGAQVLPEKGIKELNLHGPFPVLGFPGCSGQALALKGPRVHRKGRHTDQ